MRRVVDYVSHDWQLKLTSVGIAFLLWLSLQSGKPYSYRMTDVPVRVVNRDAEWVVSSEPSPAAVDVTFRGRFSDLLELRSSGVSVIVPVEDVRDTAAVYALRSAWIDLGGASRDIAVGEVRPDSIRITFDRIATRLVGLRARFTGVLPAGHELAGPPVIDPTVVRVSGPAGRLARMDSLQLQAIDVRGITSHDTTVLTIDTTGMGVMVSPRRIRVILPVRAVSATAGTPIR